ncbi:C40 family peptidase [Desertibacillus haloalkaliphilus]|uniref:C40 family peptidase n=1 Tax=Desertibacillus haloalkaliphilus TaxID=1328930 RepID=UPI001C27F275|nr:C40 family peptidase [Desertibacillus haloalkaliphilus]MBU8906208.1 C40 family peptidase [Desertibacillus haloalkaliphilus]
MLVDRIIDTGLRQIGKPYRFNAAPFQTNFFDCSSFIQYIFGVHGIRLPRNSRQQFQVGRPVPFQKIRKGDLLFFTTKNRRYRFGTERIGHVALYIGNGKILHTFLKGKKVQISSLNRYWKGVFLGAKRLIF